MHFGNRLNELRELRGFQHEKLSEEFVYNVCKGTWECAALEGILFRTSSLALGILFCNFGLPTF